VDSELRCESLNMNLDLFASSFESGLVKTQIAEQAWHLAGYIQSRDEQLKALLDEIIQQAPLRQMITPGGQLMSVQMTTCGDVGWVSDSLGYRYQSTDPLSNLPWPEMPEVFKNFASEAAAAVGFDDFEPDSCLINYYQAGTRLSLHQDKDELDLSQPIVSVSLGLPATFLFGGLQRKGPQARVALKHGDVVVWGGISRLAYHGILPLEQGEHKLCGRHRINLTFRKAC
jgi:DNA oxidative demethylase